MNPYRDNSEPPPDRMVLRPDAGRRAFLVVGVFLTAAIAVTVIAGSLVTAIQCHRSGDSVSCSTSEATLVTSSRKQQTTTGLTGFAFRTSGAGKNRTEWLAMLSSQGEIRLTGSSVSGIGRDAALARLNEFARDGEQPDVQAELGSRAGGLKTLPFLTFGLVFLYVLFGNRITVTVHRRSGHVRVQNQLWPLAPRGIDFERDQLRRFDTDRGSKGSTRVVVELADGSRFPLTRSYTSSDKGPVLSKLQEFVCERDLGPP